MLRRWAHKTICFLTGHMPVTLDSVPIYLRAFIKGDIDAVCLRCYRPYRFIGAIADDVFKPSPLLQHLREKK